MANPLDFDVERVLANIRRAETPDLLSRITVFRDGMEPKAIQLIETELADRGITAEEIEEYAARMQREMIVAEDGTPVRCTFCHQPAVAQGWDWHRLWSRIPIFPEYCYYCAEHRPPTLQHEPEPDEAEPDEF